MELLCQLSAVLRGQLHDRMCRMSDPVDESFLDQYLEPASSQPSSLDKPRPVRQGLPSGYRMRHDAHYVDELESRRRPTEANGPALAFPTSIPVTFALRDMSQELEGVASCFNLVAAKAARCASAWVCRSRASASSATCGRFRRCACCSRIRHPSPRHIADRHHRADDRSFEEELRLTGMRISLDAPETANSRHGGRAHAVAGAAGVRRHARVSGRSVECRRPSFTSRRGSSDGIASCEMRQDAYRLSADQFSRLTDLEWSERPGGIPAGIGLAAAARIAQAHGGGLDARRTEAGGCVLILTIRA